MWKMLDCRTHYSAFNRTAFVVFLIHELLLFPVRLLFSPSCILSLIFLFFSSWSILNIGWAPFFYCSHCSCLYLKKQNKTTLPPIHHSHASSHYLFTRPPMVIQLIPLGLSHDLSVLYSKNTHFSLLLWIPLQKYDELDESLIMAKRKRSLVMVQ